MLLKLIIIVQKIITPDKTVTNNCFLCQYIQNHFFSISQNVISLARLKDFFHASCEFYFLYTNYMSRSVYLGYYVSSCQTAGDLTLGVEDMAKVMTQELTQGCLESSSVRCGFIGEVGSSWPITGCPHSIQVYILSYKYILLFKMKYIFWVYELFSKHTI